MAESADATVSNTVGRKARAGSSPAFGTSPHHHPTAEWCNGSTQAFGAFGRGSNPCSAATSSSPKLAAQALLSGPSRHPQSYAGTSILVDNLGRTVVTFELSQGHRQRDGNPRPVPVFAREGRRIAPVRREPVLPLRTDVVERAIRAVAAYQ